MLIEVNVGYKGRKIKRKKLIDWIADLTIIKKKGGQREKVLVK